MEWLHTWNSKRSESLHLNLECFRNPVCACLRQPSVSPEGIWRKRSGLVPTEHFPAHSQALPARCHRSGEERNLLGAPPVLPELSLPLSLTLPDNLRCLRCPCQTEGGNWSLNSLRKTLWHQGQSGPPHLVPGHSLGGHLCPPTSPQLPVWIHWQDRGIRKGQRCRDGLGDEQDKELVDLEGVVTTPGRKGTWTLFSRGSSRNISLHSLGSAQ